MLLIFGVGHWRNNICTLYSKFEILPVFIPPIDNSSLSLRDFLTFCT